MSCLARPDILVDQDVLGVADEGVGHSVGVERGVPRRPASNPAGGLKSHLLN